jgi:hypothetical protein
MNAYNASSIKILGARQLEERFFFVRVPSLADKYRHIPRAHIARLLEAAELSGWPFDLAERRYLEGDKSIVVPVEFVTIFAELADQRR